MKCGYYVSTPKSRLLEECQLWAALALYDAMRKGPVAVSLLPGPVQQQGNTAKRRRT